MAQGLVKNFLEAANKNSARPALRIREESLSYAELVEEACKTANCLIAAGFQPGMLASLLCMQSFYTYSAILGIVLAGGGYVPTNPRYPALRNSTILKKSKSPFCLLEGTRLAVYQDVLFSAAPLTVVLDKAEYLSHCKASWPQHKFLVKTDYPADIPGNIPEDTKRLVYLLFTSGSTGEPKGVGISYANLEHYLANLDKLAQFDADDRFMQMFDLTFDFAVHPLWLTFTHGASLYVENDAERLMPANFLLRNGITQWNSVPTTAAQMKRLRQLKPGAFDNIRYSVFCGEALPLALAQAWLEAVPNSIVDNLYGPTEATVACMYYRLNDNDFQADAVNGLIPIGKPFPDMQARILGAIENSDAQGERPSNDPGELLLAGPQLASGYWENEKLTAEKFIHLRHDSATWYRTGDLARLNGTDFVFLGREDSQVKIKGYRVEISEVEGALMQATQTSDLVVLASSTEPVSLTAVFLEDMKLDFAEVLELAKKLLPEYMLPAKMLKIAQFPRNNNGKVDRLAIGKLI